MYVYLLWTHDEYGPEMTIATMNRSDLPSLLMQYDGTADIDEVDIALEKLLRLTDEDLARDGGKHSLEDGWGGLHLQVIRLESKQ